MTTRSHLLGLPLDAVSFHEAADTILCWTVAAAPARAVVTLNPEICVQATQDERLRDAVRRADLSTADGVGSMLGACIKGLRLPHRVMGIELIDEVMRRGGPRLRVFFYGGAPGVAERAGARCAQQHGIQVAGTLDGYTTLSPADVMARIARADADLILTGLGAPLQECFNAEATAVLPRGVLVGVGGSLDVFAGRVPRAPQLSSALGVEFAWRIIKLKRWKRARRLLTYLRLLVRTA